MSEPEVDYRLTEGQALYLCMCACGDEEVGADICRDMIKVIMAWRRGELLPQSEVPRLAVLYREFETPDAIL